VDTVFYGILWALMGWTIYGAIHWLRDWNTRRYGNNMEYIYREDHRRAFLDSFKDIDDVDEDSNS
jgi:hypothetical protein